MSHEIEPEGRLTTTRTIRLTPEVLARLQAVCDHLGVTVSSYITQEVGRAVARDEGSLLAKKTSDSSLELLARAIQSSLQENDQ